MLGLFKKFVGSINVGEGEWEALEALMDERAYIGVCHALGGYGISWNEAFDLLEQTDGLTPEQETEKSIILAAIDNIVDFAVAEEYQLAEEVMDTIDIEELEDTPDHEIDEDSDEDDWWALLFSICNKYNNTYAWIENMDIEYAMIIAAYLAKIENSTMLMYMTQGDERVRPWHLQYEGYTAPKHSFPAWLIPPIEHQCRCYLVEQTDGKLEDIVAQKAPKVPDWFNPTFKESVALGGRIFSDEHPYFQKIDSNNIPRLREIAERIKQQYYERRRN